MENITQYPVMLVENVVEEGISLQRIGYKVSEKTHDPFWIAHADTKKGIAYMSPIPGDSCSDPRLLRCIANCFLDAARSIADAE